MTQESTVERVRLTPEQAKDLQEAERGTITRDSDMVALVAAMKQISKLSLEGKEYLNSRLNKEISEAYAARARASEESAA